MKIYTRTGDDGTTGLGDGQRIAKDHERVEAYGAVDELNSSIGVLLAYPTLPAAVSSCLTEIQHELFDLGGELCIPGSRAIAATQVERIWLPFAVWLVAAAVLLPAASRRWWLAAQAGTALAVTHVLLTSW